jgi:hypothetical protein
MDKAYITFPPPCRGRAREGVEVSKLNCATPILTFPLSGGRNEFDFKEVIL